MKAQDRPRFGRRATNALLVCIATFGVISRASAAPPALHASGNSLVDSSGTKVRLKGVNIPSLEWSNGGENVLQSLGVATTTWKSRLIRLPISQDRWFGNAGNDANAYRSLVDSVVNSASNAGVYVLVDLHWSDEGVWGANLGQHNMPDDNTTTAWNDIANRYKNNPAVLFDAYNEPHDVSWSVWRNGGWVSEGPGYHTPGMQGLVNTIRATGANNVIVVGGLDWTYDLTGVMNGNAISDNNIMYAAHVYVWKSNWDGQVTVASGTYPILIGEFGDDKTDNYQSWMPSVLSWIDSHNYNATAWSFHPGASPCLLSDWSYTPSYWFGSYVMPWLAQGSSGGGGGGGTESPYSGTAVAIPGLVQAENYDMGGEGLAYHDTDSTNQGGQYRTDGVDIETTTDTNGGYNIGYTAAGEWLNYMVNAQGAGSYTVSFRVASGASGGTFHLQDQNGTNLTGTVTVPATGGWQTWTTVTANATLPTGAQTLRLVEDSGGFNVNWINFAANALPATPTGLTTASGNAQVSLSWGAVAGATSYNPFRSTSAGGEGTTAYKTGITSPSFTDTGLTNGATYYYTVAALNSVGSSGQSAEVAGHPTGTVSNTPYSGTPAAIPGTIPFDNFDKGGEGVAYHDSDAINNGNAYRTAEGVDIEATTDTGGNAYNVGWTAAGEWMKYTVNIATATSYNVSFRVASQSGGGTMHLEDENGTNLTGSITVPVTGGWQTWATVPKTVNLPAGQHVLKLVVDSGTFNMGYMAF